MKYLLALLTMGLGLLTILSAQRPTDDCNNRFTYKVANGKSINDNLENCTNALLFFQDLLKQPCYNEVSDTILGELHFQYARSWQKCIGNTLELEKDIGIEERIDSALIHYAKVLDFITDSINPLYSKTHLNLGIAFIDKGYYSQAEEVLQKSLSNLILRKKTWTYDDSLSLADAYFFLGETLRKSNDFYGSIGHTETALELYQQLAEPIAELDCYNLVATDYNRRREPDKAQEALDSLKYKAENFPNREWSEIFLSYYYVNQGNAYHLLGVLPKAKLAYERAIKLSQEDIQTISWCYNNLAIIYRKEKQFHKGLELLQKVIDLNSHDPLEQAKNYDNQGDIFRDQGELVNALNAYQNAIELVVDGFQSDSILNNPDLKNSHIIGDKFNLITFLGSKADAASSYALGKPSTKREKYLSLAHNTYKLAISLIEEIRKEFSEDGSKLLLMEEGFRVYEGAIATALALGNDQEAFQISEKAKAALLFASLQEQKARNYSQIAPSLIQKEFQLKVEIQNELLNSENSNKQLIISKRQSLDSLIRVFENKYPEYHKLKYDLSVASVPEIQERLPENTAMVKYFVGDDSLYIFTVTQDKLVIAPRLPRSSLNALAVDKLLLAISNSSSWSSSPTLEIIDDYIDRSTQLYDLLLADIGIDLPENIIIVPDGILGYLPFETLLTENPEEPLKLGKYPYLLKEKVISYAYSSTIWLQIQDKVNPTSSKNKFLAFAPSYTPIAPQTLSAEDRKYAYDPFFKDRFEIGYSDTLTDIWNANQVTEVLSKFDGKSYVGNQALAGRFISEAPLYPLLFIATHGFINDDNSRYNRLAFTPIKDGIDNEWLYLADFYNLSLPCELVVMSACVTNIGEIHRGEGVASLARGLFYAGTQSVVATFWQVKDVANQELMGYFFSSLKEGNNKAKALTLAKRRMLEKSQSAAPFYWAAPVVMGNTRPLVEESYLSTFLMIVGIGFLAVVFSLRKKFFFSQRM